MHSKALWFALAPLILFGCSHPAKVVEQPAPDNASKVVSEMVVPSTVDNPTHSASLPSGTVIPVELAEVIDSETVGGTLFFIGRVPEAVLGPDKGTAIPAGANALLVVRLSERQGSMSRMILGLNRVQYGQKTIKMPEGTNDIAVLRFDEDASQGPSHRSVHLQRGNVLNYKVPAPVALQ